jgi:hypothetical protein
VPQINLLSHFQGDAIDSMVSDVLGDTSTLGSHVTNATNSVISAVHYNEDQAKAAYSYVYKFLADQEGGGGAGWKPSMTGLHLTPAPAGKGRSMWVSAEGKEQFLMHGEDAIKKISQDR